jgi:DNA-binding XRE family transcriptional regulator
MPVEMTPDEFSKLVSVFRAYFGYSQIELSKICDCHRTTIVSIEKTPWRTRQRTVDKIANVLANCGIKFASDENGVVFVFTKRSKYAVRQH